MYFCCIGGGVDYGSGLYSIMFPPGVTSVPFDVSIINDNIVEGNKSFDLSINPSSLPSDVTVGSPDRVRVLIVDDDGN